MTLLSQYALLIVALPPGVGTPFPRSTASNSRSHQPVGSERRSSRRSAVWKRQSCQKPNRSALVPAGFALVQGSDVGAAIGPSLGCTRRSGLACQR